MKIKILYELFKKYYIIVLISIISFLISFLIYFNFNQSKIDKSLIVLPFLNLQNNSKSNYFSDGITEDLIAKLSTIQELNVISREVSLQYEDTKKPFEEIARKHELSNILTGEIIEKKDSIFIKCEFKNIYLDKINWKKEFFGLKNDIPQIQSKLIKQIVGSLNVKLNLSERKIINASHFKNFDSYNYYLKGNFEFNKRTFENYDISINYYNKVLQLDPFNSKIYSLISNSYAEMYNLNKHEIYKDLAISASERAIKINSKYPGGYLSRANILTILGHLNEAYRFNIKASEINGLVGGNENNALIAQWRGDLSEALNWYKKIPKKDVHHESKALVELSNIYYLLGKKEKAIDLMDFGLKNQPNSFYYNRFFVIHESFVKNKDNAKKYIYRLQRLRPNDSRVNSITGLYYLWFRDYNKSLSYFQKVKYPWFEDKIAIAFILRQKWGKKWSDTILKEVLDECNKRIEDGDEMSLTRYYISMVFSIQEDIEKAFIWLEKSVDEGFLWTDYLEIDPRFDILRNDKRFNSILQKINLKLKEENNEIDFF